MELFKFFIENKLIPIKYNYLQIYICKGIIYNALGYRIKFKKDGVILWIPKSLTKYFKIVGIDKDLHIYFYEDKRFIYKGILRKNDRMDFPSSGIVLELEKKLDDIIFLTLPIE